MFSFKYLESIKEQLQGKNFKSLNSATQTTDVNFLAFEFVHIYNKLFYMYNIDPAKHSSSTASLVLKHLLSSCLF